MAAVVSLGPAPAGLPPDTNGDRNCFHLSPQGKGCISQRVACKSDASSLRAPLPTHLLPLFPPSSLETLTLLKSSLSRKFFCIPESTVKIETLSSAIKCA